MTEPNDGTAEDLCEEALQEYWDTIPGGTVLPLSGGAECTILFRGMRNRGKGPDFRSAVIRIGGVERKGSVELHRRTTDWIRHGHAGDPAYADVILHVVGEDDSFPHVRSPLPRIPVLPLSVPVRKTSSSSGRGTETFCASFFAGLSDESVIRFTRSAGLIRLRRKSDLFLAGLIRDGSPRTFFLRFMELLGLPSCRDAFRLIAERVLAYPDRVLNGHRTAILWGESGLLPDPASADLQPDAARLVHSLWNEWWRLRRGSSDPPGFGICRPLDTPERKIAYAASFMAATGGDPASALLSAWMRERSPASLMRVFQVSDPFWESRAKFTGPPLKRRSAVAGKGRLSMLLTDLAFPVLHAMLRMRKETDLLPVLEEGYSELPGNPDNRILKRMRTQCFPGRSRIFRSAVCQQGLIGLYRDFCQPASFLCSRCPLFASLHGEK